MSVLIKETIQQTPIAGVYPCDWWEDCMRCILQWRPSCSSPRQLWQPPSRRLTRNMIWWSSVDGGKTSDRFTWEKSPISSHLTRPTETSTVTLNFTLVTQTCSDLPFSSNPWSWTSHHKAAATILFSLAGKPYNLTVHLVYFSRNQMRNFRIQNISLWKLFMLIK